MRKIGRQGRLFLIIDAFLILFCIPGIYQFIQKADLPFHLIKNQDLFIIRKTDETIKNIKSGDILISIDGMKLKMREEIEIYLDSKSVGEKIHIKYLHQGITSESNIPLVRHYSLAFIICDAISGFLFILFGIFVLLKCPENKSAKIFHWGSLGVAIILLYTWGNYTIFPYGSGIIVRILFQFAYVLTPVVFVYFSLVFPVDWSHRFKYPLISDFLLGIIIALINVFYFLVMVPKPIVKEISNYLFVFNINRTFSILNIIAAILIFILSYRKATNVVDRKKLKWLLTGFITGPFTFSVLWAIPQLFTSYGLIPEILIPVLMTAIPITFTIAIVKYHLMDIDLLIRRSVVYSIVVFFLIVIYIAIISGISNQILSLNTYTPSIIAAIVIALLFEPFRRRVQLYVDKKFFRIQYNFREALRKFLKDISEINTVQHLADIVVKETQEFIPVDKIGFFLLKYNRIRMVAHQNFNLLVNRSVRFDTDKLKSDLSNPVANPSRIEAGVTFEPADFKTFNRWGMNLVIPVRSAKGEIFAFIVLGEKKSGNRYTAEDIDLLNNVASNIAATIERINIQEQLIRKNMEAERLDELNQQKTLFVSTVSHDLRTPLASIKIFSEMLKSDKQIPEKQKQYLEMIEGESDRLTRLINNVLGFASMESGTRKYTFESISLNTIVKRTVETLSYQLKLEGFKVEEQLCEVNCMVRADPDAVTEALINTIANAIKFSGKQKVIYISTFRSDSFSCIEVKDRGIGIKSEDLKNIFKPFFRSEISNNKRIRGTGLGLSIIKHVMDAHKGKIEVESVPGEGTAFILKFPIEIEDKMNPDNRDSIGNSLQKEED